MVDVPAHMAPFAAGEARIDLDDDPPVPGGLVFEFPPDFAHGGIADSAPEAPAAHAALHSRDPQGFDTDNFRAADQVRGGALRDAAADFGDAGVQAGDSAPCLEAAMAHAKARAFRTRPARIEALRPHLCPELPRLLAR
ncbi:MAG TPA: hypothetical protein VF292_07765 [Rhodanobacteraceae bacterium]